MYKKSKRIVGIIGKSRVNEILSPDLVFELMREKEVGVYIDGFKVRIDSRRLRVFDILGIECTGCGIIGSRFYIERASGESANKWHLGLYGLNKSGSEIMFTVDHIIPKKLGGPNHIFNYQPMCTSCNSNKSSTLTMKDFLLFNKNFWGKPNYRNNESKHIAKYVDRSSAYVNCLKKLSIILLDKEREKLSWKIQAALYDINRYFFRLKFRLDVLINKISIKRFTRENIKEEVVLF
jgi:5-methylcytosine-specific restriction endonuclease McrA